MANKAKVIKISADSTKSFMTRSFFTPSIDKVVQKWAEKGYSLVSNVPINNRKGKTTHFLLTFEKN